MGETLIIRNSAGFHLQGNFSVQQDCDVFYQCFISMSFLKKLFQKPLVEIVFIFVNVDVLHIFHKQQ